MRLFVYGTLRAGGANHHYLAGTPLLATVRTDPSYELVDMGGYPAMVEGGTTSVTGELYEVDPATLARIDLLEEVPEYYRRKALAIDGQWVMAYLLPAQHASGRPRVVSGDYLSARVDG